MSYLLLRIITGKFRIVISNIVYYSFRYQININTTIFLFKNNTCTCTNNYKKEKILYYEIFNDNLHQYCSWQFATSKIVSE